MREEKCITSKISAFLTFGNCEHCIETKFNPETVSTEKCVTFFAVPSLLYGSEFWVLKQSDIRRIKTAEMKFMRDTAGYSLLDHRRNEDTTWSTV
jgi:hypothetical protein